jgi:hypothetical protein
MNQPQAQVTGVATQGSWRPVPPLTLALVLDDGVESGALQRQ